MTRIVETPAPIVTHRIDLPICLLTISRQGNAFTIVVPGQTVRFPMSDARKISEAIGDLLDNYETLTA